MSRSCGSFFGFPLQLPSFDGPLWRFRMTLTANSFAESDVFSSICPLLSPHGPLHTTSKKNEITPPRALRNQTGNTSNPPPNHPGELWNTGPPYPHPVGTRKPHPGFTSPNPQPLMKPPPCCFFFFFLVLWFGGVLTLLLARYAPSIPFYRTGLPSFCRNPLFCILIKSFPPTLCSSLLSPFPAHPAP